MRLSKLFILTIFIFIISSSLIGYKIYLYKKSHVKIAEDTKIEKTIEENPFK